MEQQNLLVSVFAQSAVDETISNNRRAGRDPVEGLQKMVETAEEIALWGREAIRSMKEGNT